MSLNLYNQRLFASAQRLKAKGLLHGPTFSHSVRLPGRNEMALCIFQGPNSARLKKPVTVSLDNPGARNGTHGYGYRLVLDAAIEWPAVHRYLYALRPDAGALLFFAPPWTSKLIEQPKAMPLVFDEQCRQLGPLTRIAPNLLEHTERTKDFDSNAYIWSECIVVMGVTLDKAVFNAELLEKCAKAYLLAQATGQKIKTIPWWVQKIARARLRKDQARAATSYSQGKEPGGFTAY